MKELLKSFEKYREYRCVSCGCPMELKRWTSPTWGASFPSISRRARPADGIRSRGLATGKMLEVEKILEDK